MNLCVSYDPSIKYHSFVCNVIQQHIMISIAVEPKLDIIYYPLMPWLGKWHVIGQFGCIATVM